MLKGLTQKWMDGFFLTLFSRNFWPRFQDTCREKNANKNSTFCAWDEKAGLKSFHHPFYSTKISTPFSIIAKKRQKTHWWFLSNKQRNPHSFLLNPSCRTIPNCRWPSASAKQIICIPGSEFFWFPGSEVWRKKKAPKLFRGDVFF